MYQILGVYKTDFSVSIGLYLVGIVMVIACEMFYNLLTAPQTVSNTYAQVAQPQSCANHVQHIECLSHATCCVACPIVQRDSSAIQV